MNDRHSHSAVRSVSFRNMADNIRARACRLRHAAIRAELSALAADYERLASFEATPFSAWLRTLPARLGPIEQSPLLCGGWLQVRDYLARTQHEEGDWPAAWETEANISWITSA
jgi:hypothetical protein